MRRPAFAETIKLLGDVFIFLIIVVLSIESGFRGVVNTMARIFKAIALLLVTLAAIGFMGCSKNSKKATTKKSSAKQVVKETTPQATNNLAQVIPTNITEEDTSTKLRNLPSNEFGRENPFVPLLTGQPDRRSQLIEDKFSQIAANEAKLAVKSVPEIQRKSEALPDVKLTLVIDGSTAIFEENRVSKVVSVGDSLAGMKILEIKNDRAVLGNGDKKYAVALGGKLEEISSSTPKSIPTPKSQALKTKKR